MRSIKTSLALFAILPFLFSCEKETSFEGQDSELRYSVSLMSVKDVERVTVRSSSLEASDGAVIPLFLTTVSTPAMSASPVTKGQLINDNVNGDYSDISLEKALPTFYLAGWNSDKSAFVPAKTPISWSDGKWSADKKYYWKKSDVKTFFAYANLTTGASVECKDDGGQTLTYTLPLDAASQTDILLGFAKGNGVVDNEPGIAEIGFSHPLTAIVFRRGIINDDWIIKSIRIKGVAASGSLTMGADGTLSDWTATDYSAEVYQTKDGGLPVDDAKTIGEPFIIIPQDTEDHEVQIEVETTDGLILKGTVDSDEWEQGTTNIYTVGLGEISRELKLEVSNASHDLNGGKVNFVLTTTMTEGSDPVTALRWKMQYSSDNETWYDFNDIEHRPQMIGQMERPSGYSDISDNSIWIQEAPIDPSSFTYDPNRTATQTYDLKPIWDANVAALQNLQYGGGSISAPKDLSAYDVFGNPWGTHNTANCYVVKGYGYFCLPLVYGNAIKGNEDNVMAYFPGTKNELQKFKSSTGYIDSPYIVDAEGSTDGFGYRIVWQDVVTGDEIIEDGEDELKIIDHPAGGLDCKYLMFHISRDNIKEGNVLLAVTDKNGTILWSWHIWVTPKNLAIASYTYDAFLGTDYKVEFLNYNLGWTDGARGLAQEFSGTKCYVRVMADDGSGAVSNVVTLERQAGSVNKKAAGPAGPYYQWGRKDPQMSASSVIAEGYTWQYNNQREAYSGEWKMNSVASHNLEYSVSHPNEYLYNGSSVDVTGIFRAGTWYEEGELLFHNLWSATNIQSDLFGTNVIGDDEPPVKTVYDPCPAGFQVPCGNAFTWLNNNSTTKVGGDCRFDAKQGQNPPGGLIWHQRTDLFFPAAGSLGGDSDGLQQVGTYGHYWTAISYDVAFESTSHFVQGKRMYFHTNSTTDYFCYTSDQKRQDFGYSIRPMKEVQTYRQ